MRLKEFYWAVAAAGGVLFVWALIMHLIYIGADQTGKDAMRGLMIILYLVGVGVTATGMIKVGGMMTKEETVSDETKKEALEILHDWAFNGTVTLPDDNNVEREVSTFSIRIKTKRLYQILEKAFKEHLETL